MRQLLEVRIGADPRTWVAAGFHVTVDRCRVGATTLVFVTGDGIAAVAVDGFAPGRLDGIPLVDPEPPLAVTDHPNGVVAIDHLVVRSPDVDRTTVALVDAGLELRRERRFRAGQATVRQSFFWLGDVICELVGDDAAHGEGPAVAWGLAFTALDLDHVVAVAGSSATAPKPAVQPGRRILALHGLGVPVAVLSPHRPPRR